MTHNTLSARMAPRRYLSALKASLAGRAEVREGWRCTAIDPARGLARFEGGEIAAGRLVLAAETGASPLLEAVTGRPSGSGVKGQAGLPVIQGDRVFIVAHTTGVAVGSTSEKDWDQPGCDTRLDALVARARLLCPALATAPVVERRAGIRPKAPGNDPMVGSLPGMERVIVATGGYKIGFGLAHLVGDAVAAMIAGKAPRFPLPEAFAPERHLGPVTG